MYAVRLVLIYLIMWGQSCLQAIKIIHLTLTRPKAGLLSSNNTPGSLIFKRRMVAEEWLCTFMHNFAHRKFFELKFDTQWCYDPF